VNVKFEWSLFGEWTFMLRRGPKRDVWHWGITNRCSDGKYVIFLDYDGEPIDFIRDQIENLQHEFMLGEAFIFKTKHGHHVIFLDKVTLAELVEIFKNTTIDPLYRDVPMRRVRREWVLRQSNKNNEKITYAGKVSSLWNDCRQKSNAHAECLHTMYDIPLEPVLHKYQYDEETDVTFACYEISKRNN
jgi:hypothetical protein